MKYRVTDKHKFVKEGFEIHKEHNNKYVLGSYWPQLFLESDVKEWIELGWIEEIQPKEFTRDDMLNYAAQCILNYTNHKGVHYVEELNKYVLQHIN